MLALGCSRAIAGAVTRSEGVIVVVMMVVGSLDMEESADLNLMTWNKSLWLQKEEGCKCGEEVVRAVVGGDRGGRWG